MIYKSLIHLLSSNILLLFPLSSVFLFISFKSLFKFEKNKIFLKSKKILPFEIKNHVQEITVCYIPVLFSTAYILYFGTYSDFILLFLGSLNFFALILLSDKKIKTQLAKNKKYYLICSSGNFLSSQYSFLSSQQSLCLMDSFTERQNLLSIHCNYQETFCR